MKEYTFLWFIDNYSYCWHRSGQKLVSPEFTTDGLQGTAWTAELYPRGKTSNSYVSAFLKRSENDDGPEKFLLTYELSAVEENGSAFFVVTYKNICEKGDQAGWMNLVQRDATYFPQDTLTLRFKIRIKEGTTYKAPPIYARTRIGIEKVFFLHVTENFSVLGSKQTKTVIQSRKKKDCFISSCLSMTDNTCCENKITVEIAPSDSNHILRKCKISLLAASGNIIACREEDKRLNQAREEIRLLPLSLTKEALLRERTDYLPDDKLTLLCECTFSTGVELVETEEIQREISRLNQPRRGHLRG